MSFIWGQFWLLQPCFTSNKLIFTLSLCGLPSFVQPWTRLWQDELKDRQSDMSEISRETITLRQWLCITGYPYLDCHAGMLGILQDRKSDQQTTSDKNCINKVYWRNYQQLKSTVKINLWIEPLLLKYGCGRDKLYIARASFSFVWVQSVALLISNCHAVCLCFLSPN